MSWICEGTNHVHQIVPQELITSAVEKANALIEDEEMG